MNTFQSLIILLAALMMINTSAVLGSSSSEVAAEQMQSQLEQIQLVEDENKRILGELFS